MELVIKLSDKEYSDLQSASYHSFDKYTAYLAMKNGTPLPKGHGDLIDRSKIGKAIPAEEDNCTGMGMSYDEMDAYNDGIESMYNLVQGAKPIIEADKGSDSE